VAQLVVTVPHEAAKNVGEIANGATISEVWTDAARPLALDYYISAPLRVASAAELNEALCETEGPLVFVHQPFLAAGDDYDEGCLLERGAQVTHINQRGRGNFLEVWVSGG
jgi:hypothetical protein